MVRVLAVRLVVPVGGFDKRVEHRQLFGGCAHRVVRFHEVGVVGDDGPNAGVGVGWLEHVLTHEVVQVAHGFHRHGLVEQFHRLLAGDAEQASHAALVFGVAGVDGCARAAQAGAQSVEVGAEVGEVAVDAERVRGCHEEAVGLPGAIFLMEDLREGDGFCVTVVDEHPEDDGVVAVVAQPHGAGCAGGFVALRLVVPFDVAAERAFAGVGSGGFVVGDAVRG